MPMPAPFSVGAISLFVGDIARARDFYATLFGAEPLWTDDVSAGFPLANTVLNLLATSDAAQLVGEGNVARPGAPVAGQLSVFVADVDATVAELTARGIGFRTQPTDLPWGVRAATLVDPDGHSWEFATRLDVG